MALLVDHGKGADAVECLSTAIGARDISVIGFSGLDHCRARAVRQRANFAHIGFRPAGTSGGEPGPRLFWVHVVPNLKPVLYAQFWISIPVFILSEANLESSG